jgi:uncharacterized protein (TIGR04255 family)
MPTMDKRPNELPDFARPPLDEVALSVQFDPLPALQTPQIGLLWAKLRADFPHTEQHAPLDPVIERFGQPARSSLRFEFSNAPAAPRCWFLKQDGTELIQIQQDRFVHNWRKLNTADAYPRYGHVREQFRSELAVFCEFLEEEKIGVFSPNQCEVTYTNVIAAGEGWSDHGQLERILAPVSIQYSDANLGVPENARFAAQYVLSDDAGKPKGRLHVSCQPAFRAGDNVPLYLLNMVARGEPSGRDIEHVLRFMDEARESIVRGFASVTTSEMHTIWGRKNA